MLYSKLFLRFFFLVIISRALHCDSSITNISFSRKLFLQNPTKPFHKSTRCPLRDFVRSQCWMKKKKTKPPNRVYPQFNKNDRREAYENNKIIWFSYQLYLPKYWFLGLLVKISKDLNSFLYFPKSLWKIVCLEFF